MTSTIRCASPPIAALQLLELRRVARRRRDVSPKTRKLVVLEDGAKWILRGESRVDTGGGKKVGGAFREDPPAKKWPRALHQHAVAAWARLVDR